MRSSLCYIFLSIFVQDRHVDMSLCSRHSVLFVFLSPYVLILIFCSFFLLGMLTVRKLLPFLFPSPARMRQPFVFAKGSSSPRIFYFLSRTCIWHWPWPRHDPIREQDQCGRLSSLGSQPTRCEPEGINDRQEDGLGRSAEF